MGSQICSRPGLPWEPSGKLHVVRRHCPRDVTPTATPPRSRPGPPAGGIWPLSFLLCFGFCFLLRGSLRFLWGAASSSPSSAAPAQVPGLRWSQLGIFPWTSPLRLPCPARSAGPIALLGSSRTHRWDREGNRPPSCSPSREISLTPVFIHLTLWLLSALPRAPGGPHHLPVSMLVPAPCTHVPYRSQHGSLSNSDICY